MVHSQGMVSFAQEQVLGVYDVNAPTRTATVMTRDSSQSDRDILDQLNIDDYEIGEEVMITSEEWAKIQAEQERKKKERLEKEETPTQELESPSTVIEQVKVSAAEPNSDEKKNVNARIDKNEKTQATRSQRTSESNSTRTTSKAKRKKRKIKRFKPKKRKRFRWKMKRGKCYSF